VPEATRTIISEKAVRAHRSRLLESCGAATSLALCSVAPDRTVTYEKETQTDGPAAAFATPAGAASSGTPRSTDAAAGGQGGEEAAESAVSAAEAERERAREAEAAMLAAAEAATRPLASGPADADAASLRELSRAVERLLSRGSDDWDLLSSLSEGRRAGGGDGGAARVMAAAGRLGVGAVMLGGGAADAGEAERKQGEEEEEEEEEGLRGGTGVLGGEGAPSVRLQRGMGCLAVSDLDWWGRDAQLVAVAYRLGAGSLDEAAAAGASTASLHRAAREGGVAAAWDVRSSAAPVGVFTAEADVTAVRWHPFAPSLLLGALDSGRVVTWDTRSSARSPVSASALCPQAHSNPVYSLLVSGSANAHSILSVSADGRLCSWPDAARLGEPALGDDVRWESDATSHIASAASGTAVGVTCAAAPRGQASVLTLGGADGRLYQATVTGRRAQCLSRLHGHTGPVTSVHHHPAGASSELYADALVSSGLDWTARVWSARAEEPEAVTLDAFDDYVLDARWCPAPGTPSVVATGDNEGRVCLWSAGQSAEPLGAVTQLPGGAVTKVRWAADGRGVLCGDSAGGLAVYGVSQAALDVRAVSAAPLEARLRSRAFGKAAGAAADDAAAEAGASAAGDGQ